MRIGVFGGTFNPPHIGHIKAVEYAQKQMDLEKIIFIPNKIPPHKVMPSNSAQPQQRLDMIWLATRDLKNCEVSDIEIKRDGVSYTVDTLRDLKSIYPNDELCLLMGDDMLLSFDTWRNPAEISKLATLGVFLRRHDIKNQVIKKKEELEKIFDAKITVIENDVFEISSTDIRNNDNLSNMVSDDVYLYMALSGLYGTKLTDNDIDCLRNKVLKWTDKDRSAHVLGCERQAIKLAKIYNVDTEKARIAALLHDITKSNNIEENLLLCDRYGIIVDNLQREHNSLLHAVSGSLVAKHFFGVSDEICEAIRWHTTGKPDMSLLEEIIYIADITEESRSFCGVDSLRELCEKDIKQAVYVSLDNTISRLNGKVIHSDTIKARDYYRKLGV